MINAVSQLLQMCRNIRVKFISWVYMYTTLKCLGKRVIQTNPTDRQTDRDRQRQKQRQRQRIQLFIYEGNK